MKESYRSVTAVIDLSSPEVNRGSYCYLPYIFSNALKAQCDEGGRIELLEDFTVAKIDYHELATRYGDIYIALWSYPQIEQALYLHYYLKGTAKFIGYYPLIEELNLPIYRVSREEVLLGMKTYPDYYNHYRYLLLSDCDKHVNNEARRGDSTIGAFHPLFTSYSCPNKCKFCSASSNTLGERYVLDIEEVYKQLDNCMSKGIFNIHFTDEDFFFNPKRTILILKHAIELDKDNNCQFIALGTLRNVYRFAKLLNEEDKQTQERIWDMIRLIEIGLETMDDSMAKSMGKEDRPEGLLEKVASMVKSPILWLTITFYPGETVTSLNKTGLFLKKYGLNPNNMSPRIATNGTMGGLGQYFQYYPGTGIVLEDLEENGMFLTRRPMRLLPSYIPNSFLNSTFYVNLPELHENGLDNNVLDHWLYYYGINNSETVVHLKKVLANMDETTIGMIGDYLEHDGSGTYIDIANACIFFAVCARLQYIVSEKVE